MFDKAAGRIQALWRGYKTRESFKKMLINKLISEAD